MISYVRVLEALSTPLSEPKISHN